MLWAALVNVAMLGDAAFGLLLFVLQFAALELGFLFGRRQVRGAAEAPAGVGMVVGSMLALLGFVLALTLSNASVRFEARRAGTLSEANAIGTAWLRAKAIGHPLGDDLAQQLVDYTNVRIAFVKAEFHAEQIDAVNTQTNALQSDMWRKVTAIVRERPDAVAAQLMASFNDVFDEATAERFAFAYAIPPALLWLIIGLAVVSIAGVGYQLGLRHVPMRILSVLLIGMWTTVATLILDLGSPRLGSIRTSVAAYQWTLSGFGSGGLPTPADGNRP